MMGNYLNRVKVSTWARRPGGRGEGGGPLHRNFAQSQEIVLQSTLDYSKLEYLK